MAVSPHVAHRDGVAIVTFDRPEVRNAIDATTVETISRELEKAGTTPEIGALLVVAEGEVFSSGQDLVELEAVPPRSRIAYLRGMDRLHRVVACSRIPIVAAINGPAVGRAAFLTAACSVRVGSPDAEFWLPELQLGVRPDSRAVATLVRAVGEQRARYLLATGARIDAEQAMAFGLLHAVVPKERLRETAEQMARQFAGIPGRLLKRVGLPPGEY
ncbi:enoyl-CoA hydratase/isomerase family protein [Leifsonia sp. Root112D2]|uniref:enoyl-CoA hydratase/isomerase family protein n=1 Tax=Leifsonia sp. Root112D2 TaxID=1736426 RepID=UPI0006F9DDBA|nr:enoyl-CoA hydratase/isomerase family protein [Leifsonia sp. Root112D2]KQV06447.1 hypothetical protein ASC63_03105 [Leifsonia sp. Root112D2]